MPEVNEKYISVLNELKSDVRVALNGIAIYDSDVDKEELLSFPPTPRLVGLSLDELKGIREELKNNPDAVLETENGRALEVMAIMDKTLKTAVNIVKAKTR